MTLHLFKKDLRHERVLLLVWLFLVALQCSLIGSSARPGDRVLQGLFETVSVVVPLFQLLLLMVIVPLLVQEEPLVGTTAFWFTRPLLRSSVMRAKALFAAMLILLPLLAELAMLAAHGVTLRDIGLAIPEIILSRLSFIIVLAMLAVMTPSIGRFAIAGIILLVASTLLNMAIYVLPLLLHPEAAMAAARNFTLLKSRGLAEDVLIVFGGGAIIVHQYLTRKTARSLAIAGGVAVGVAAIMVFWSWDFLAPLPLPDFGQKADLAAIKISLKGTNSQEISPLRGVGEPQKNLNGTIEIIGLPDGVVATPTMVHPQLTLPDGNRVPTQDPTSYLAFMMRPVRIEAVEYALGGVPIVNPGFRQDLMTSLLRMDANVFRQYVGQPLKLTADIGLIASRYIVVGEMPLLRGARYDHGSEHAVITDVLRQGNGVEVVMQDRRMHLLFDRSAAATPSTAFSIQNQHNEVDLLVNRRRNEAVLAKRNIGVDFGLMFSFSGGANRLVQQTLRFSFGSEQFNLTPDLNEAWLADARFVRLQLIPVGEFSKQLIVEKFKLDGRNAPGAPPVPLPQVAADNSSFAHITLPKDPTRAQVKDYVHAVLIASQRRSGFQRDDPQIGMLLKVGANNIDVLFEEDNLFDGESADRRVTMYLEMAIQQLARPEDKELVLRALPEHHGLVTLVTKYFWQADAHDTLVGVLKDERQNYLPRAWIQAVASFVEPATYPDLKAYLVRCTNKQETFNAIRKLPGIDLKETVDAAWKKARYAPTTYQVLDGCAMAASFGYLDALDALVKILKQDDNDMDRRRAATSLKRYTPATGDYDALVAWFEAHREELVFDSKQVRFLPRPSPEPATPAAQPAPGTLSPQAQGAAPAAAPKP
jgi:hypothetical protein